MVGVVPDRPGTGIEKGLGQGGHGGPQGAEFPDDGPDVGRKGDGKGGAKNEGKDPVAEKIQNDDGRDGDGEQQDEPGAGFFHVSIIQKTGCRVSGQYPGDRGHGFGGIGKLP